MLSPDSRAENPRSAPLHSVTNRHGLTLAKWLLAAQYPPSAPLHTAEVAWRSGVDPASYASRKPNPVPLEPPEAEQAHLRALSDEKLTSAYAAASKDLNTGSAKSRDTANRRVCWYLWEATRRGVHLDRSPSHPKEKPMRSQNPAGHDSERVEALTLFADNTGELYAGKKELLGKARLRQLNGTYTPEWAREQWVNWFEHARAMFEREHKKDPDRLRITEYDVREAAKDHEERYRQEMQSGEHDYAMSGLVPHAGRGANPVDMTLERGLLVRRYGASGTSLQNEGVEQRGVNESEEDMLLRFAKLAKNGQILEVDDGQGYRRRVKVTKQGKRVGFTSITTGKLGDLTKMLGSHVSYGSRAANPVTHQFPIGAKVYVDGKYIATVRGAFPEGSTSAGFPHYKIDMKGGEKNIVVAMNRVSVEKAEANAKEARALALLSLPHDEEGPWLGAVSTDTWKEVVRKGWATDGGSAATRAITPAGDSVLRDSKAMRDALKILGSTPASAVRLVADVNSRRHNNPVGTTNKAMGLRVTVSDKPNKDGEYAVRHWVDSQIVGVYYTHDKKLAENVGHHLRGTHHGHPHADAKAFLGERHENPSRFRSPEEQKMQLIGTKMHNWHSSGGDPIYAVGSYYYTAKPHPSAEMTERALGEVDNLLRGEHEPKDTKELQQIRTYLKADLKSRAVAGRQENPSRPHHLTVVLGEMDGVFVNGTRVAVVGDGNATLGDVSLGNGEPGMRLSLTYQGARYAGTTSYGNRPKEIYLDLVVKPRAETSGTGYIIIVNDEKGLHRQPNTFGKRGEAEKHAAGQSNFRRGVYVLVAPAKTPEAYVSAYKNGWLHDEHKKGAYVPEDQAYQRRTGKPASEGGFGPRYPNPAEPKPKKTKKSAEKKASRDWNGKINDSDKALIRHLVGELHVGTQESDVVALLRKKFGKNADTPLAQSAIEYALDAHYENLRLYVHTMDRREIAKVRPSKGKALPGAPLQLPAAGETEERGLSRSEAQSAGRSGADDETHRGRAVARCEALHHPHLKTKFRSYCEESWKATERASNPTTIKPWKS